MMDTAIQNLTVFPVFNVKVVGIESRMKQEVSHEQKET
jgi:hypothetical protein